MSVLVASAPFLASSTWPSYRKRKRASSESSAWSLPSIASSVSTSASLRSVQQGPSKSGPSHFVTRNEEPVPAIEEEEEQSDGKEEEAIQKPKQRLRKYRCQREGCGKSYTKPVRLKEHERSHTNERPFACPECSATYRRDTHLAAHMRSHQPEDAKPFLCEFVDPTDPRAQPCQRRFWTEQHRNRHREGLHEGKKGQAKYSCASCDRIFIKHHLLRSHFVEAHCAPSTQPFICSLPSCSQSFPTGAKLRKHERTHDPHRYLCSTGSCATLPLADRSFVNWTALQKHSKESHPLTCWHRSCKGRTFASAKSLREHETRHSADSFDASASEYGTDRDGDHPPPSKRAKPAAPRQPKERSFVCMYMIVAEEDQPCPRAFKSASALQSHINDHHLNLRPFVCRYEGCDYAAARPHTLDRHVRALHSSQPAR